MEGRFSPCTRLYGTLFGTALTMERLFSPCTRFYDILESRGRRGKYSGLIRREVFSGLYISYHHFQEHNLDVSTEELLSAERAFTYVDLYAMLGNRNTVAAMLGNRDTVTWLTPHAAVFRKSDRMFRSWLELGESCRFSFIADGKDIMAVALSPEHLLEICDVVLRLLATSGVHSLILHSWINRLIFRDGDGVLINAPTLAYLMEQCPSLKFLSLENLEMDENHCRVLGAYSRPDLEIKLRLCTLTSAGASALAEVLGRNQGPTELHYCYIDYSVLADGLRGNSRLKSLTNRGGDQELLAVAGTLKENNGLVVLDLSYCRMSVETWDAVCDSLKTHPTLQVLHQGQLQQGHLPRPQQLVPLTPAVIKSRVQALVDMLKGNISIHTIRVPQRYREHDLFGGSVIPYLKTNRLRPRVSAIQKTLPMAYRAKVLGRALLAIRTDANRLWMLLSGNPEVAFPSTTATTKASLRLLLLSLLHKCALLSPSTSGASAVANIALTPPPTSC
jgi:hypothetical protein